MTAELPAPGTERDAGAGVPPPDEDTSTLLPRVREQRTSTVYVPSDSETQDASAPSPPRIIVSKEAILKRLAAVRRGDASASDGAPAHDAGPDGGADGGGGGAP